MWGDLLLYFNVLCIAHCSLQGMLLESCSGLQFREHLISCAFVHFAPKHILYWARTLSSIWGGNTSQGHVQPHWLQAQSSCAELFSAEQLLTRSDFTNQAWKIEGREEIQTGENLRPTVKGLLFYQRLYYCTTVSGSRKILNQWK